jgi:hypothetical protein
MSAGKKKAKDGIILAVVIIVVVGGIAGVGFFQDEVGAYVRFQGWNLQPATAVTQEFLAACAEGDGARVAGLVDQDSHGVTTMKEDGKVVGFEIQDYSGPKRFKLEELAPGADARLSPPRIVPLDGGSVSVEASYPGVHLLDLRWDRKPSGWKLVLLAWRPIGE